MNDKYTWILAGGYSAAFFSILVLFHFFSPSVNDATIGRLMDGEITILGYYFGSSVGSRNKDYISNEKKEDDKK